ncbi:hypothetical protein [Pseudomonas abietaniphila]|uniref:Uncharacterized protein n=1 Tax=Pseudomonas abietaniphila TaxID=89065 RepID=A0A1G8R3H0_9PSED|nr:hypothetical protein [Pseudomonas abietaniphila]SDJ11105.1 hypothetical protein SAMN05216605_121141 [Pseudomonas abietaniphila]
MTNARSYADYVVTVSAFGIAVIDEKQWAEWQATLPAARPVELPNSLNYAIAVAIEAGDFGGAAQLINQCDEYHQDCWTMYTTEGEYLPAGGLWWNQLDWMNGTRSDATPLAVAHVLEKDGDLPPGWEGNPVLPQPTAAPTQSAPEFISVESKHFIGSGAKAWLVSGRIPGHDDDTAYLVLADDEDTAQNTFKNVMFDNAELTMEHRKVLIERFDSDCYVIQSDLLN